MTVHDMKRPEIKRVPRADVQDRKQYQERHELSLLELLIQAHPERAKMIIERLQMKAA